MATKNTGYIDMAAMAQIGASKATKADESKAKIDTFVQKGLAFAGELIYNRIANSYKTLNTLKDNQAAKVTEMKKTVTDFSDNTEFSKKGKNALEVWQKELDKGIKMQSFGLTPKKKRTGKEMVANAYTKINNLSAYLKYIDEKKNDNHEKGLKALGKARRNGYCSLD